MDVASGADMHLDIIFGLRLVESSSLVSVKRLTIPTVPSFFLLK